MQFLSAASHSKVHSSVSFTRANKGQADRPVETVSGEYLAECRRYCWSNVNRPQWRYRYRFLARLARESLRIRAASFYTRFLQIRYLHIRYRGFALKNREKNSHKKWKQYKLNLLRKSTERDVSRRICIVKLRSLSILYRMSRWKNVFFLYFHVEKKKLILFEKYYFFRVRKKWKV